jgi:hypothetical protein
MKKSLLILAALAIASSAVAAPKKAAKAAERAAEKSYSSDAASDEWSLAKKIGLGYQVGNSANQIEGRFFMNDKLGVYATLGLNITNAGSGSDINGRPVNDPSTSFGIGAGAMFNLARPVEDVFIQAKGGLSYAYQSNVRTQTGVASTTNVSTIGLGVGLGFEAFIPMWRALSVSGEAGLGVTSASTTITSGGASSSSTSTTLGVNGSGNTPVNVAVHYYF